MRTTRLLERSEALIEADRCLGCHDAPCTAACPASVDIPGFIARFCENNLEGAGQLIYDSCPLGSTCGLACPTTVLCEGACTLNHMGQTPIRIGSLQTFISLNYGIPEIPATIDNPGRVAIIGAGPSGLGCAIQLRRHGHIVHVYERSDSLAGLVDRVIPAHRLPHEVIHFDLARLDNSDIQFHFGYDVDAKESKRLVEEFDAVFIGIGMSSVKSLSIPGSETSGVFSALDYLAKARSYLLKKAPRPVLGSSVIIIGGGNVALDAAVISKLLGADRVIVIYRRSKDEMPAWETEYLEAASLGVEFRWLSQITRIITDHSKVTGVEIGAMRFVDREVAGRRWVEPDPSVSTYEVLCDNVIMALGQTLDLTLTESLDLTIIDDETIAVNSETFQTQTKKVFAAGVSVSGGSTIVNSMSQGMVAGRSIHNWLQVSGEKNE